MLILMELYIINNTPHQTDSVIEDFLRILLLSFFIHSISLRIFPIDEKWTEYPYSSLRWSEIFLYVSPFFLNLETTDSNSGWISRILFPPSHFPVLFLVTSKTPLSRFISRFRILLTLSLETVEFLSNSLIEPSICRMSELVGLSTRKDSGFSELTNVYPLELSTRYVDSWTIISLDKRDWSEKTNTQIPSLSESVIILMNSGLSIVSLEPDSTSEYSPFTENPLELTHFMIEIYCLLTESPFTLVNVEVLM